MQQMPAYIAGCTQHTITIVGRTCDGRIFRPSDWAQRLLSIVARHGTSGRIRFHPKVSVRICEGIHCLVLETSLKRDDPISFDFLMRFGEENNLQVRLEVMSPPS